MSIKKSLAIAVSLFLMASGLDVAAANPVAEVKKLLTAVRRDDNYDSSVAVAARAEFIKLANWEFANILSDNPGRIFDTAYGFSLIHGWMLSKHVSCDLPFYVNQHFSFDNYIEKLKEQMPNDKFLGARLQEHITIKWKAARNAIEADRWAYYQHMQYIPAAIAQAGIVAGTIADTNNKAYVLTLQGDDFRSHIDSVMEGGIPADVTQAQAKLESIMIGLLNHYDLDSLLPTESLENLNIEKFVEFVVEHVPALYHVPMLAVLGDVERLNKAQTGEQLRIFVSNLIRVGSLEVAVGAAKSVNTDFAATVHAAIEFVRQQHDVTPPHSSIKVSLSLVPIYYGAAVSAAASSPSSPLASGALSTPARSAGGRSAALTPFSPRTPLGGRLVIAGSSASVTKMQTVYPTPMMEKWMDAAADSANLTSADTKADEAADILKYFASYLIEVKDATKDVEKGPYTGSMVGGYTYLSDVLAMRYKLLAQKDTALAEAIAFINAKKNSFFKSLNTQGVATSQTASSSTSALTGSPGNNPARRLEGEFEARIH